MLAYMQVHMSLLIGYCHLAFYELCDITSSQRPTNHFNNVPESERLHPDWLLREDVAKLNWANILAS